METPAARDIIQIAKDTLKGPPEGQTTSIVPQAENLPATVNVPTNMPEARPPLPVAYQKFGGIPQQLRENAEVNVHEVKRLNLAATLESLERAADSYESFPTPDGGFAVAGLSEIVLKLTKDLERTQDPTILLGQIKNSVLNVFVQSLIYSVAVELKNLQKETIIMIPDSKRTAFEDAIKNTMNRTSPAFTEAVEEAEERLKRVLNIKEKKERS